MTNAVIYARYSCSSQDEQTIEMQIEKCRTYAEENELHIIDVYCDEAKTGRNGNRLGLQELLRDSKTGAFQIVIMYMSDRFYRNTTEALDFEKKLNKNGVSLAFTYERFDDTPFGKYMKTMSYANAQLYSDMYSLKISDGLKRSAKEFKSRGSNVPFGYVSDDNKNIIIDNENMPYVVKIFEMYADGFKYVDIYNYLNNLGVKTKRGGRFNKSSIGRILQNKMYIGTYTYKDQETPNVIPRIISDDLFRTVQEKIKKTKSAPAKNKAKEEYVLSGKIYCSYCRKKMIGHGGTSKTKRMYKYYKCKSAIDSSCTCSKKLSVSKDFIEDSVFSNLAKLIDYNVVEKLIPEIITKSNVDNQYDKGLAIIDNSLKNNKSKETRTLDAITECLDPDIRQMLFGRLKELKMQQEELLLKKKDIESKNTSITESDIRNYLNKLRTSNEIVNKKKLVNAFVHKIIMTEKSALIVLKISNRAIIVPIESNSTFFKKGSSFLVSNGPPLKNFFEL